MILAIAFGLLEVLLRVIDERPSIYVASTNPDLIYELNPHHPEINSLGMRQPEVRLEELEASYVIATVGDSHTYSVESTDRERSYPARLEYHLGGNNVRVLNFGVPGYNMAQEVALLESKVNRTKPDLVILQYCVNDTHVSNFIWPERVWLNRAIHTSEVLPRVWKRLLYSEWGSKNALPTVERLWPDLLLFEPGLVGTRRPSESDPEHAPHPPRSPELVPDRYHVHLGEENLKLNVNRFGRLARQSGAELIATGFIAEDDRELYTESGFRVYSFYDIFAESDMQEYGYNPADTSDHFSPEGSDFIARSIARYIEQNLLSTSEHEPDL